MTVEISSMQRFISGYENFVLVLNFDGEVKISVTFRGPGQKLCSNILDHMLMIQEHLAKTDERRIILFEI